MEIKKSVVTKLTLTGIENLDPVSVFLEDYKLGQGKLTVECFGDAWSHYWGAMADRNLVVFIAQAGADYITGKLFPSEMNRHVIDYDKISYEIGEDVDEHTLLLHEDKVAEVYGECWQFELPNKESHHWKYLYRIVLAVKEAVSSDIAKDA